jgi:hypothetical protein|eukprot:COSAG01_NODE_1115_length_11643_cov_197.836798_11_plen_66_part_00
MSRTSISCPRLAAIGAGVPVAAAWLLAVAAARATTALYGWSASHVAASAAMCARVLVSYRPVLLS